MVKYTHKNYGLLYHYYRYRDIPHVLKMGTYHASIDKNRLKKWRPCRKQVAIYCTKKCF